MFNNIILEAGVNYILFTSLVLVLPVLVVLTGNISNGLKSQNKIWKDNCRELGEPNESLDMVFDYIDKKRIKLCMIRLLKSIFISFIPVYRLITCHAFLFDKYQLIADEMQKDTDKICKCVEKKFNIKK